MNDIKFTKRSQKTIPLVVIGVVFLIILIFHTSTSLIYADKTFPNLVIGGEDVGGKQTDEIQAIVKDLLTQSDSQRIIIVGGEFSKSYLLSDLGIQFNQDDVVREIASFGKRNNLLTNLVQRIQSVFGTVKINITYQTSEIFDQLISDIEQQIHQDPQEAKIVISGSKAEVQDSIVGQKLSRELFERTIKDQIAHLNFSPITLPVDSYSPILNRELAEITAQKIADSLQNPIILTFDKLKFEISTEDLWEWLEIDTTQNMFVVRLNEDKLNRYFKSLEAEINRPMRSAVLEIKNNRAIKFVPDQAGAVLRIKDSMKLVQSNLLNTDEELELVINYLKPKKQLANLNNLGINELVASGTSNFRGSPYNRRHNIKIGAARFDGVLIVPQATFSFNETLGIVDTTTGYLPELVIKGDETIPEHGGGLCQVSTTAFRAILDGGYPIDARKNHAYRVSYYEPAGSDATIYPPYPDLKFTNNSSGHILMHTYIDGNNLYFDFYGTKIDQRVEIEGPYTYNVTDYPDPVYIETSAIPEGEVKQIETAHKGADAVLYRYIYDGNDKEIRKDTFRSHYIPWPAKYLVGIKEAPEVEADLDNIPPESSADEEPQEN